MLTGIICGFFAAFFQSGSYLCTRLFIKRHQDDIGTLLALSHIVMGVISVLLVLVLKPDEMPDWRVYARPLAGTAGFYILGQTFLFAALINAEASRVSPLLGLKIVILAVISASALRQPLGWTQWAAVTLCALAVLLLSYSGKRLRLSAVALVVLACLSYSLSDLNIKVLAGHFSHLGVMHGAVLGAGLTYILCGAVACVVVMFKVRRPSRDAWMYSLPFALSWLIAMVFLFCCFALIGVVFGNIIQSTRGLISIGLGFLISCMGFERLEPKITRTVLVRRLIAGTFMTGAVFLYHL